MRHVTRQNRSAQRGYSLTEILIAMAVFAVVMVAALLIYDRSNLVFKQGNESAEMQQNTRVAFEKLVSDVRMAGFDYKRAGTPAGGVPTPWAAGRVYGTGARITPKTPNGHYYTAIKSGTSGATEPTPWPTTTGGEIDDTNPTPAANPRWIEAGNPIHEQPDEQIEYAGKYAITMRANYDYELDAANDNGVESIDSNGHFQLITTGNDEIVTYALKSRSNKVGANAGTITFYADVNASGTPTRTSYPGGNVERKIDITGVDLTNAYPPYTLMRYTLTDAGAIQETALADNIRSMTFEYWQDTAATEALTDLASPAVAAPDIGGVGQYNPNDTSAAIPGRIIRSKIRAVTVTVVGMNPQQDLAYTHPTDTVAKNYRQFELKSTIVARNLGVKGVAQSSSEPPDAPTIADICYGYCGVAVVSWTPAPGTVDTTYKIAYDDNETGTYADVLTAGSQHFYAVDLTQLDRTKTYYFKVIASNEYGDTVSTNTVKANILNATKPDPPASVAATTATAAAPSPNTITVTWKLPSTFDSGTITCDVGPAVYDTTAAEVKGFRLYRSEDPAFKIDDADVTQLLDEDDSTATRDSAGNWTFVDKTVANCKAYYYRVVTVEWCAEADDENDPSGAALGVSEASAAVSGMAWSTIRPGPVTNLTYDPASLTTCDLGLNQCSKVILNWDPVTKDENGDPATVSSYVITRQQKKGGVEQGAVVTLTPPITDGSTTFTDGPVQWFDPSDGVDWEWHYEVYATYCALEGDPATVAFPKACTTDVTIKVEASNGDGSANNPYDETTTLTVAEGSKAIKTVFVSIDDGTPAELLTPYVMTWSDNQDGHTHKVEFAVQTEDCFARFRTYVVNDVAPCQISAVFGAPVVDPSDPSGKLFRVPLIITNASTNPAEAYTIKNFDVTWGDVDKFRWGTDNAGANGLVLPSGGFLTATGVSEDARTVTFTPPLVSDRTIPSLGSITYYLQLERTQGNATLVNGNFTDADVIYTRPLTSPFEHDCDAF